MKNVENAFLSQKMVDYLTSSKDIGGGQSRYERFMININRPNQNISNTITTNEGSRPVSTFVKYRIKEDGGSGDYLVRENNDKKEYVVDSYNKQLTEPSISGTIVAGQPRNQGSMIMQVGVLEMNGEQYAIRKLTPKECMRLMGFDDEDYEQQSKVVSSSQVYKQAGNGIVVNVLEAIFGQLY